MLNGEPSVAGGCALGERPYAEFGREERNHVAVLYAALLRPDNLVRFLRTLDFDDAVDPERAGAFGDYAGLHDVMDASSPRRQSQCNVLKNRVFFCTSA